MSHSTEESFADKAITSVGCLVSHRQIFLGWIWAWTLLLKTENWRLCLLSRWTPETLVATITLFPFPCNQKKAHDPKVALVLNLESPLIALFRKSCSKSYFHLLPRRNCPLSGYVVGRRTVKSLWPEGTGVHCLFSGICDSCKRQTAVLTH